MAKVYVKFNSAVIKEVNLTKDEMTIGRKPNNDIAIDHPTISGFHGKIKKAGDVYTIEDLNSTNGTFLNGRRIKSAQIKDNDQIGIAGHILDFHSDEKKKNAEPIVEKTPEQAPSPLMMGFVRLIAGGVDNQSEIQLKDLVTYIGTGDQALIKIKGFMAPDLAAAISRRPEGFFLKAVKPGYPKVNGLAIQEQILLENGAEIEVGGTNLVFYRSDGKKASEEKK